MPPEGSRPRSLYLDGKVYSGWRRTSRFVEEVHSEIEELKGFIESTPQWKTWKIENRNNVSYDLCRYHLVQKLDDMGYEVFMYGTEDKEVDCPERFEGMKRNEIDWSPPPGVSHKRVFSKGVEPESDNGRGGGQGSGEDTEKERDEQDQLDELEGKLDRAGIVGEEKSAVIKARVNQGVFRDRLLAVYGGQCCITGIRNEELLIASHIKPWSESEKNERLIPENGLLLNALHDKAFDRGLITLTDDYRVKVNEELSSSQNGRLYEMLLKDEGKPIKSPTGFKPDKKYLKWHRRKHGFEK